MNQSIPERRKAYRQKMAELAKQGDAKIEQFMEAVLAAARRRYPDVKMQWHERETQDDLLSSMAPELVLQLRLNGKNWYYATKERDVLIAPSYDELLARSVSLLIATIERESRKAQDA